uniref:NADH dehydrogenase subunit 6 n=1 Tax=Cucujoidea sp. 37 KM-2017 TaxID=2219375 RepID=A0A346RGR4_9CUCU|nr:NADH dehydrogenase subunit 6 [Cucujoidea sp. 37 KM-2017]
MSWMILTIPVLTIFTKHPISMGMMILMQTLMISLNSNLKISNPWFPYILFMIMVGGLMVLFMYMTSVASNEKFKFSLKTLAMLVLLMICTLTIWNPSKIKFNTLIETNSLFIWTKFISHPNNILFLMMIVYLLMTLIATIKIMVINSSPLRQKF